MSDLFWKLFSTDFMPHVYCLRLPEVVWLHAISDGVIAVSYFLIPFGLVRLVQKRRDIDYDWLFFLFAAFILSCGATHVMGIVTLWVPVYRFDGMVKVITAATSLPTALILARLVPKIASLPSLEQWRRSNQALEQEVAQRKTAEANLLTLNAELEQRVQQRTQELAEKNAKLLRITAAFDLSHGMIRDLTGQISFWCEGNKELYGWTKQEALGRSSHELLRTQTSKPFSDIEEELLKVGTWEGELVHVTKAGAKLSIASHWVLQRGTDGAQDCVIEVNTDITDRLRAGESARHLAEIVGSSNDAIIGTDLQGAITSWNSSAERMFGYTAAEMIGASIQQFIPDALLQEEAVAVLERDGLKRYEIVLRSKSGKEVAVALTISPIRDSTGAMIGRSKILQDISERKVREEAIRLSEERQRLAVEAGQVGLWFLDSESNRFIWTSRCKELHGLPAERESPSFPEVLALLHPDDRESMRRAILQTLRGKSDFAIEYRTRGVDYRTKWVQAGGRRQLDFYGNVKGIHGTFIDLTDRKENEEKLRRANTQLEQFAYAAAHDLQEPLRNLALSAALLRRQGTPIPSLTPDQLLGSVIDNARRMEAMVKDLLAYSRALDGAEDNKARSDTGAVLQQVLQNLSAAISEKQAKITLGELPVVSMLETHLLQILQNLIGNALKYSGPERPLIEVGSTMEQEEVLLFVKDNGPGIAPEFHDRAFGMFKRLHGDGEIKGTGIGLAVCKRIVEHYGGRIWIESATGAGAKFLFTVPSMGKHFNDVHEF